MLGLIVTLLALALLDRLPTQGLCRPILVLLAAIGIAALPARGGAQTLAASGAPADTTPSQPYWVYVQPTQSTELQNYLFDTFGPYPLVVAAVTGGIDQIDNSPPEWRGGAEGYGKRLGSDFGIDAVSTSTRFVLSEALKQDPLYYRCACKGVLPRLGHAVISTFTARTGENGHRVFSAPALVGPYAGSFAAVYGWYPDRFGAKDAFRIGNYSLLEYMGGNIVLEFFHTSPHWLSRMHLTSRRGAPDPAPSQ
jgi:hypothetical protein